MNRAIAVFVSAVLLIAGMTAGPAIAIDGPRLYTGTMSDGATYRIEVPANWNGTLFLYSHGQQGEPNPARVAGDDFTKHWLLQSGYALAGGSYACVSCYEPNLSYPSQLKVLDTFEALVGHPTRTIAWGHSVGGAITADLMEFASERFDGALASCTYIAGSVGRYNARLDHAFVMQQLLGFDRPLVNIGLGTGQLTAYVNRYLQVLDAAQQTPAGRARIALAEAIVGTPDGVDDPFVALPAPTDYAARQFNQYILSRFNGMYHDDGRAFLEVRIGTWQNPGNGSVTGGNFSWNTGVDYRVQLQHSASQDVVQAMYALAGLDLQSDLDALNGAPRIEADPGAVQKLIAIDPIFSGNVGDAAVMTMHTLVDPYGYVNQDQGYAQAFADAGTSAQLRQLFVGRAGHCEFTAAETISAIQVLLERIETGIWPSTQAAPMNERAGVLGGHFNKFVGLSAQCCRAQASGFVDFSVPRFPRNFNTHSVNPYP